ncbi:MAG: hypothetical protein QM730_01635 [Anaerolineales bacterium]
MKRNKVFHIFLVLTAIVISACGAVTPVPLATPVETPAAYPTVISDIAPTQTLPVGQFGAVKFSLEATRDGKTYDVLIAYKIMDQGSQRFAFPEISNDKLNINDVNVRWIDDIDMDGELEYIVELIFCGVYCFNKVQIFHYDKSIDNYRIFDSLNGHRAERYLDTNNDGNPEIISQDYDYQIRVGGAGATRWLAPIKIYQYENKKQKFDVVTSKYPDLVIEDSNQFLDEIKSDKRNIGNIIKLAGYLYDMSVIGKQDKGIEVFNEICPQFVKPTIENPDWTCDGYLSDVQKILSETKLGSE